MKPSTRTIILLISMTLLTTGTAIDPAASAAPVATPSQETIAWGSTVRDPIEVTQAARRSPDGRSASPQNSPAPEALLRSPSLRVHADVREEENAVLAAAELFADAGLVLPDLDFYVHGSREGCMGYNGVFNQDGSGHRIDICNVGERIILHELAHAWEHHSMSEGTRASILMWEGMTSWNDPADHRSRRGIEAAAEVLAAGLATTPLVRAELAAVPQRQTRFVEVTGARSARFAAAASLGSFGNDHTPPQAIDAML